MAGSSIYSGIFNKPYDINTRTSKIGVALSLGCAFLAILLVTNSYSALILSQVLLSIQLPFTIVLQVYLTSSRKVMGSHANTPRGNILLWGIALIVITLNLILLWNTFFT